MQRATRVARALTMLCVGSAVFPSAAYTQLGIEGIFKEITDVSFFSSCWNAASAVIRPVDKCPFGEHAFGFETSFRLREVSLFPHSDSTFTNKKIKEVRVHTEHGAVVSADTTYEAVRGSVPRRWSVLFELGLGYAQYSGFRSNRPEFDLRGAVREIPALSVYATLERYSKPINFLGGYVGVRTGLAQFRDLQAITPAGSSADTVAIYSGDAQTFQIGAVEGITLEPPMLDGITLYGEWVQMYRNFSSIKWTTGSGTKIPAAIPRGLDFSGNTFSLGVQIKIR